jgi:hypothetical protein
LKQGNLKKDNKIRKTFFQKIEFAMKGSIDILKLEEAGFFVVTSLCDLDDYHGKAQDLKRVYETKEGNCLSTETIMSLAKDLKAQIIYLDRLSTEIVIFKVIKTSMSAAVNVKDIEEAGFKVIGHVFGASPYERNARAIVVFTDPCYKLESTEKIVELAKSKQADLVVLDGTPTGLILLKLESQEKRLKCSND